MLDERVDSMWCMTSRLKHLIMVGVSATGQAVAVEAGWPLLEQYDGGRFE